MSLPVEKNEVINLSLQNRPCTIFSPVSKITWFGFTVISETTIGEALEARLSSNNPTRDEMIKTLKNIRTVANIKSFFTIPMVYNFCFAAVAITPLAVLTFLGAPTLPAALVYLAIQIAGIALMALGITLIQKGTESIRSAHAPTMSKMYETQALQAKALIEKIEENPNQAIQIEIKEPFGDCKTYVLAK